MALPEPMVGAPVSATGAIAAAPVGSTLPTDATTEIDTAFKALGLVGEDGFEFEPTRGTEGVKAWGGVTVRIIQSDYEVKARLTLLESTKGEVLQAVFGSENVVINEDKISVKHNEKLPERQAFIVDMVDGQRHRRIVIPNGQLVPNGATQFVHNALIQYPVEITAYPDEQGNPAYEYIAEGAA